MTDVITSTKNSFVKDLLSLQEKSRNRKKNQSFLLEGERELNLAIKYGYEIEFLVICPEIISPNSIFKENENFKYLNVSKQVYSKLAYRGSTEGIMAKVGFKSHDLSNLSLSNNPLILVAEAPEKPGNIGALLRTADAANIDAVIIANPKTDLYNPNIIRSSIGCVFSTQIGIGNTQEVLSFLRKKDIKIYSAALKQDSEPYYKIDFSKPSAIVVGTESTGLSDLWLNQCDSKVIIPMEGAIDSMNVSVSAAVLIFEAKRQRI